MNQLMAKSPSGGRPGRTLDEHTCDVVEAFVALFGTPERPTHLCRRWLNFFNVSSINAFLQNGLASAWIHDWGKANDGFQHALDGGGVQLIRHEHLSAMLMHHPVVRKWLQSRSDLDQDVILSAVATHHLKASLETFGQSKGESDTAMRVWWDHNDFGRLLEKTRVALGIDASVPRGVEPIWCLQPQTGDFDAVAHLRSVKQRLDDFDLELEEDKERRRLLWAVRAALIAADSAGSGLVREEDVIKRSVKQWIGEAFDPGRLLDGDCVRAQVIEPRIRELAGRGRWNDWTDFQIACDALPDRALLLAPCGSGKTLAAWRWIAARLDARPAARVIFLYPTRGTATEGFRDYVSWAPEADAALVHGTAEYDLDGLFDDVDDDRANKSFESRARLFALKQWNKRIFSATVDQFLAFLQYGYGPVCQLPLLVDSILVVDEVHSFDRGMFSALQDFLKAFRVPVLCMTATLPHDRRAKLEECGLEVYPRELPPELLRSATYPRYRIHKTTFEDAEIHVRQALKNKKRVLWVVNNVRRCQALARKFAIDASADQLRTEGGAPLFCYHSRFRLIERNAQHKEVIEAFKRTEGAPASGVLAVTTQVCEMSLDLDADVIVTEEAPVTSLIQRMGRGCRQSLPSSRRYAEVLIYTPEDEKPYTPEQLAGVAEFIQRASSTERVSQADLEAALADVPQPPELPKSCRFIDSGPWAAAGEESFRETDGFTRQAVLPDDVEDYARLRRRRDEAWRAEGLVLPAPVYLAKGKDSRLPNYLAVTEGGHYMRTLGYLDEPRPAASWVV